MKQKVSWKGQEERWKFVVVAIMLSLTVSVLINPTAGCRSRMSLMVLQYWVVWILLLRHRSFGYSAGCLPGNCTFLVGCLDGGYTTVYHPVAKSTLTPFPTVMPCHHSPMSYFHPPVGNIKWHMRGNTCAECHVWVV